MTASIANYQASLKLLLRKGDEFLLLQDTWKSLIDLPGGRINDDEFEVSLEDILRREVTEELGNDIAHTIEKPLFQFRRFHTGSKMPVLLTVYGGVYISGEIKLSDEHEGYKWVHKDNFDFPEEAFLNEEEYIVMKRYFESIYKGFAR